MRALVAGSMSLPMALVACGGTDGSNGADSAGVAPPITAGSLSPASVGTGPAATKHVRLSTAGAIAVKLGGGNYIGSHELGHASLNTVDEYVESGLDDLEKSHHPALDRHGELVLSGTVKSTKELLAWRREAAAGTAAPKTLEMTVFDADGHEAVRVTYSGALPKIARPGKKSQARDERFTLTYAGEAWQPVAGSTLRGVALQVSSTVKAPFDVLQTAGGRACRASIIGPEIIGPELVGIIGPERVGIIGPERVQQEPNTPPPPANAPGAQGNRRVLLNVDATAGKWFQAALGQQREITLRSATASQQQQQLIELRWNGFVKGYSLTPLDGDSDTECTEDVEIDPGNSDGHLG